MGGGGFIHPSADRWSSCEQLSPAAGYRGVQARACVRPGVARRGVSGAGGERCLREAARRSPGPPPRCAAACAQNCVPVFGLLRLRSRALERSAFAFALELLAASIDQGSAWVFSCGAALAGGEEFWKVGGCWRYSVSLLVCLHLGVISAVEVIVS